MIRKDGNRCALDASLIAIEAVGAWRDHVRQGTAMAVGLELRQAIRGGHAGQGRGLEVVVQCPAV